MKAVPDHRPVDERLEAAIEELCAVCREAEQAEQQRCSPSERALLLVEQASRLLHEAACAGHYEDPRHHLLRAVASAWSKTAPDPRTSWHATFADVEDRRWAGAAKLLRWDEPALDDEKLLSKPLQALLVQVVEQTTDLAGRLYGGMHEFRTGEALELRAAMTRLEEIVHALTSLHALGAES